MFGPICFITLIIFLVPLNAFQSDDGRKYLFGQHFDCANCGAERQKLHGDVKSLRDPDAFRFGKGGNIIRITDREDSIAKRRGALDSLFSGGMFGKAKRNDAKYETSSKEDEPLQFDRNLRTLNNMHIGSAFGRAIKRYKLDSEDVEHDIEIEQRKRVNDAVQELKIFLMNSIGNPEHKTHTDRY